MAAMAPEPDDALRLRMKVQSKRSTAATISLIHARNWNQIRGWKAAPVSEAAGGRKRGNWRKIMILKYTIMML